MPINDKEHGLISALVLGADMVPVIDAKITLEHFGDPDHRKVFTFIQEHYAKFAVVPSADTIRGNWPTYKLYTSDEPISYYAEELRRALLHDSLLNTVADMQIHLEDKKPEDAYRLMAASTVALAPQLGATVDDDLHETWAERVDTYLGYRDLDAGLRGITTGYQTIDERTHGLMDGQFILIVGLPKSGKTTTLMTFAKAAADHAADVLFLTFEMSVIEMASRYDSQTAQIDHHKLVGGHITTEMRNALEKEGKRRTGLGKFIMSADVASATTISGIAAKIDEYKPRIVYVDGIYLLDDENGEAKGSSQALTNITRGIKRLAQQKQVPIVGTTQVLASKVSSSRGVTAGSVGYSSSFAQDCDLMIAVEGNPDDENEQTLNGLLSRSGPGFFIGITWNWKTGTFEETELKDVSAPKEESDGES